MVGTGQPLLLSSDPQRCALLQESLELADANPCEGFENRRLRLEAFICEQHVRFLSVKDVRLSPAIPNLTLEMLWTSANAGYRPG